MVVMIDDSTLGPARNEEPPRARRLFFALWPDDTVRGAITRASRDAVGRSGGRATAKRNLHVTVAFLGHVDEAGLEQVMQVPPIAVGAFEVLLDALGYWHESRTLWLAPHKVPEALTALERALLDGLEQRGFERERRLYRPHLTLARRARPVEAEITAIEWRVAALTLVESVPLAQGVHYEPLAEWPL
jgi:2'-5' RNA ligase